MKGSDGNTIAMVHEKHGTIFVYDTQELERHEKLGWKRRPDDWKERLYEKNLERRKEAIKVEQEKLRKEAADLEAKASALGDREKAKVERVVGVDKDGDGTIDQVFAPKKKGRPKKVKE